MTVTVGQKIVYDRNIAFELYNNYVCKIAPLSYVLAYLQRSVALRITMKYRHLGLDTCEDLVQSVMMKLIKCVKDQIFPEDDADGFNSFLLAIIDNHTARAFSTLYDDVPGKLDIHEYGRHYQKRFRSQYDVEDAIYLNEIPELLCKDVVDHLRFDGEFRAATEYVLQMLLSGRRVVHYWIKNNFRISNHRFLVEHAVVNLRKRLYEARKDIQLRPDNDGFPLWGLLQNENILMRRRP